MSVDGYIVKPGDNLYFLFIVEEKGHYIPYLRMDQ